MAGITKRTLHHYDDIGLLSARRHPDNNYRYYTDQDLLTLQQILFYRRLGFALTEIKDTLNDPDFSLINKLRQHKKRLHNQQHEVKRLLNTIDDTLSYLEGKMKMSDINLFDGFTKEKQKKYAAEAAERWDPELVKNSTTKWNRASPAEQQKIMAESEEIYKEIAALMTRPVSDADVQTQIRRWHQHLTFFYEPTPEILRGLGQMYLDDARFKATFDKLDENLAAYLKEAITFYVDNLGST